MPDFIQLEYFLRMQHQAAIQAAARAASPNRPEDDLPNAKKAGLAPISGFLQYSSNLGSAGERLQLQARHDKCRGFNMFCFTISRFAKLGKFGRMENVF